MAAAQPSASTFDWKQAIVFLAFLVPLHSRSMLPDAQVVPPPQEILPDCSVLLHSATSAAEPPADSVVRGTTGVAVTAGTTGVSAGTTVGATVVELHSQPNAAAVPATPPPLVVSAIASVAPAGTICVADPELHVRLEGPEIVQEIRELESPLITN